MNWSIGRASRSAVAGSLGLFCLFMGGSLPSYSATPTEFKAIATAPETGKRFGTVWRIRGEVVASPAGSAAGGERKLKEGDLVYVGDRVRAAALAEAVLKTEDAGLVAIRPGTEFVAVSFAAEDKATDSFTVRLVTGSLRVISGWIARTNRSNPEGTYDKVNRGGTTLQVGENKLDIDPGRVGFVRAPANVKERALMTILLPVLLDKVPNFYVPGEFDSDLDKYSKTADQESPRPVAVPAPAAAVAAPPVAAKVTAPVVAPAAAPATAPVGTPVGECVPTAIAKTWLKQLDGAIAKRNGATIIAMFAPEAAVRATVRGADGKMASVDINREELVKSTLAAMKGLTDYKQRRVWTEGKLATAAASTTCDRINLRSVVVEQGKQSGKPYRFESLEEYTLELRAGKWLSTKAETTQQ
ncbi:MAG: hypothetical protein NTY05_04380 [Rhodocyclales bacterium]|nr:hypothetical protein [Rhodocyclales bacterium]